MLSCETRVKPEAAARLTLPVDYKERAIYVVDGIVELAGCLYDTGSMLVLRPEGDTTVISITASRLMLLGGEPVERPRHI